MMADFSQFKNTSCVVTGGLGFIGSQLAIRLFELGANVTIVDNCHPGTGCNPYNIHPIEKEITLLKGSMGDEGLMQKPLKEADYLFDLGGATGHGASMQDPAQDLEANTRSHLKMLMLCRDYNPDIVAVYTSSRSLYGPSEGEHVKEDQPLNLIDINAVNKYALEEYYRLFHKNFGLKASILRLTNIYGPGHLLKHHRLGFIGWFINRALQGEQIQLFGDGEQLRDMLYVGDTVNAILVAAIKTSRDRVATYNIASGKGISLKTIAEELVAFCPQASYTLVPFPDDKKKIDVGSFVGDITKARKELSWQPEVTFKQGIAKTIEYYQKHKDHYL